MTPIGIIAGILALPTFTMILGGTMAFWIQVHPNVIAALQHFASGILIGAVGSEMVPTAEAATGMGMVALAVGFILGFSVLLFVGRYDFSHWKKCYKMDEEVPFISSSNTPQSKSSIPRSSITNISLTDIKNFRSGTQVVPVSNDNGVENGTADTVVTLHEGSTKPELTEIPVTESETPVTDNGDTTVTDNGDLTGSEKLDDRKIPIGLVFAVIVDASIDGLLIGINALSGVSAGLVTGIGLAIEMGLLGVSTCSTLRKTRLPLSTIISLNLALPFVILVAGLIGATVLHQVEGNAEIAVTSFGCAGLLYLVTEELMIEAHEEEESNRWFVTVMFFIGFLFVVFLDKLMAEYVSI